MKAVITKEFTFDSAHQLPNHFSKCRNLHGHTYKVIVSLEGELNDNPESSDYGMVLDYAEVKDVVKPIIDAMDHAFLCDHKQWLSMNGQTLFPNTKLYYVGRRTTAENLAYHIMERIHHLLPVVYVTVKETESSSATVFLSDFLEDTKPVAPQIPYKPLEDK